MTTVAQGEPGREIVRPEPIPAEPKRLAAIDLRQIAHLLHKSALWKESQPKEEAHEIAALADTDLSLPDDEPRHPALLRLEWVSDPVLREVIRLLSQSTLEPFTIHRESAYFLMVRRR